MIGEKGIKLFRNEIGSEWSNFELVELCVDD
jgi:hypothetical protein